MQNRLIQCNIEEFASADINRSRSNSNCSSTSSSFKSISRSSPNTNNHHNNRSQRLAPWRLRASASYQSIRDVGGGDSLIPLSMKKRNDDSLSPLSLRKEENLGW